MRSAEQRDRNNQDAYMDGVSIGDSDLKNAFFAVYDGHGKDGDKCALLTRCIFQEVIANGMNTSTIQLEGGSPPLLLDSTSKTLQLFAQDDLEEDFSTRKSSQEPSDEDNIRDTPTATAIMVKEGGQSYRRKTRNC